MTSRTSASDSENSAFGISGFRTIGIPREQASVPKRPGAGEGWGVRTNASKLPPSGARRPQSLQIPVPKMRASPFFRKCALRRGHGAPNPAVPCASR